MTSKTVYKASVIVIAAVMPIFLLVSSNAKASERISSKYQNLAEVGQIYVGPGLVSVIEFPEPIVDVKIGSPDRIKTVISTLEPRELTIYLSSSSQFQTNMLIRSQNRVYIFDVIPSLSRHQDYLKIRGAFSSPEILGSLKQTEQIDLSIKEEVNRKRSHSKVLRSEKLQ